MNITPVTDPFDFNIQNQHYRQQLSLNVQSSLSCTNLPYVQCNTVNKPSASYTNLCFSNREEPQSLPDNSVVNLSNRILTPAQLSLLSKGLNFCPMPGSPNTCNKGELAADISRFKRNLRLIAFFGENNGSRPSNNVTPDANTGQGTTPPPCSHPDLRDKSPWTPPIGPLALERLLFLIEQDLGKYTPTPPTQKNLHRSERAALAELKAMSDIIIKPADKGSAVVVLNKHDYINEGLRQLSDTKFYKRLDYNPTESFNDKVKEVVEQLYKDGEISEGLKRYLIVDTPRTPQLYLLPKIHKGKVPPPGRPIESACSSPTERISQLCDIELRPLVLLMLSYIKDTTHFLKRLASLGPQPPGTILVVLDVNALYPSIPIEDGLHQVGLRIHKYRDRYKKPSTSALIKLMRLVLEKNNFQFNGVNYLQIAGTAMGTRMAPQFANLYMAQFEEKYVYSYKPDLDKYWFRFIDDVFLLWHHGEEELQKFLSHLNTCHKEKTIQFSSEHSREGVPFLDTWV